MKSNEIRERFLSFFEKHGHKLYPSAPLVPEDKSILFTVAGMVPFKTFFLGYSIPQSPRATSSQRCIRTNDIESIGKTARHLTTFEMLGNFSFGDYFKKEAIQFGWDLVTKELKIPADKLIATVYKDDDEAYNIWKSILPESRITRLDKDNNFWEMGAEGPCGPCSEIYYAFDSTDNFDPDDGARFIEIYNMVFMQYNKQQDGRYLELPKKNIDTGLGLERVAFVLQKVPSVFETDLIYPIKQYIQSIAKTKNNVSENIIVDHLKSACFLINEGVRPSNEKQGYVLRRLIRRAARYGYELGITKFMANVVGVVSKSYPFLLENIDKVKEVIDKEETKFNEVLVHGLEFANDYIRKSKDKELDADFVFKLYDTYGFPFELTKEIAEKSGKYVDEKAFQDRFEKHQDISRSSAKFDTNTSTEERITLLFSKYGSTKFVGYDLLHISSKLLDVHLSEAHQSGDVFELIFDKTPFYAESGGQVGDKGVISGNNFQGVVLDVQKKLNLFIHYVKKISGDIANGTNKEFILSVDAEFRRKVKANHTATHLLHAAVKKVLGDDVRQAGSLVTDDRLRLDLYLDRGISVEEIKKIEDIVNIEILRDTRLVVEQKKLEEAKKSGAVAYFEDRYGDVVRVVQVPNFSAELCGGTHVSSTGEIGLFKILSEKSMSANTRRIEAITGLEILKLLYEQQDLVSKIADSLKVQKSGLLDKVNKTLTELSTTKSEIGQMQSNLYTEKIKSAIDRAKTVNGMQLVEVDMQEKLLQHVSKISLDRYLLIATSNENSIVLVSNLDKLDCAELLKDILSKYNLKGGGRKDFARAKLDNKENLDRVVLEIKEKINKI